MDNMKITELSVNIFAFRNLFKVIPLFMKMYNVKPLVTLAPQEYEGDIGVSINLGFNDNKSGKTEDELVELFLKFIALNEKMALSEHLLFDIRRRKVYNDYFVVENEIVNEILSLAKQIHPDLSDDILEQMEKKLKIPNPYNIPGVTN